MQGHHTAFFAPAISAAASAVLILAVVVTATAAQAQGSIKGCVSTNVASVRMVVTVTAIGSTVTRTTHTDNSGCYNIDRLPAGSYQVRATSDLPKLQDIQGDRDHPRSPEA